MQRKVLHRKQLGRAESLESKVKTPMPRHNRRGDPSAEPRAKRGRHRTKSTGTSTQSSLRLTSQPMRASTRATVIHHVLGLSQTSPLHLCMSLFLGLRGDGSQAFLCKTWLRLGTISLDLFLNSFKQYILTAASPPSTLSSLPPHSSRSPPPHFPPK